MLMALVITAFLFSAFFSMSEIIFTVIDRVKIRIKAKSGSDAAVKIKRMVKNPDNYLIPILIGNNIANVAYATFFAYLAAEMRWRITPLETTLLLTLVLVMFAEIMPKIFAQNHAEKLGMKFIYPFYFIVFMLSPFSYLIKKISRKIMKIMKMPSGKHHWEIITKSDIHIMVEEAAKRKAVKYKDAEIIKKLLSLGHKKVKEIMIHRKNIVAFDIKSPLYRLKKLFVLTSFSKIIVYDNDLDNINGVIFVRDMLDINAKTEDLIRPVVFVRESISILDLFKTFKTEKASISVAIDEFGGCVGIVTMHDILELIVGKVDDTHENNPSEMGIIYRQDQNIIILDGSADLEELRNKISSIRGVKENILRSKNETVNGYIINTLKRIPSQGEVFEIDGFTFRVVKARKNFLETLILQL